MLLHLIWENNPFGIFLRMRATFWPSQGKLWLFSEHSMSVWCAHYGMDTSSLPKASVCLCPAWSKLQGVCKSVGPLAPLGASILLTTFPSQHRRWDSSPYPSPSIRDMLLLWLTLDPGFWGRPVVSSYCSWGRRPRSIFLHSLPTSFRLQLFH